MSGISGYFEDTAGQQKWIPIKVDSQGQLLVSLGGADVQIGAVEIKDGTTDNRAGVAADGRLQVDANLQINDLDIGAGGTLPVVEYPVVCAVADIHTPAANTAAVVTYGAAAGVRHAITGMAWSYSGGIPVGGRLTIADAGVVVFDFDITDDGPGAIEFPRPKMNAAVNTALVVTLAAGGAGVTGKLNILNHWTQ